MMRAPQQGPLPRQGPPLGTAGAALRARAITGLSAAQKAQDKYRAEFARYHGFCVYHGLDWFAMKNDNVLAFLEERCESVGNAISAPQWRSHLWTHAEREQGCRAYDESTDGPFWARAYKGLTTKYGADSAIPLALTRRELLLIYDAMRPDIERDPIGYVDWVHLLFSYHFQMRPNEHTGARARCVAKNLSFERSRKGARVLVYTFQRGTTKGERKRGIVGPSRKALRSSVMANGQRESTLTREMPGSPICLLAALTPMIALRRLHKRPNRLLFPSARGGRFHNVPMTAGEWNKRLKAMLRKADIAESFTARGVRAGRRADFGAAGLNTECKDQLGRWAVPKGKGSSAGARYDRLSVDIADRLPRQ